MARALALAVSFDLSDLLFLVLAFSGYSSLSIESSLDSELGQAWLQPGRGVPPGVPPPAHRLWAGPPPGSGGGTPGGVPGAGSTIWSWLQVYLVVLILLVRALALMSRFWFYHMELARPYNLVFLLSSYRYISSIKSSQWAPPSGKMLNLTLKNDKSLPERNPLACQRL